MMIALVYVPVFVLAHPINEAMEFMKSHMENTKSNEEFLVSMNS